jgi:hypothetical protein
VDSGKQELVHVTALCQKEVEKFKKVGHMPCTTREEQQHYCHHLQTKNAVLQSMVRDFVQLQIEHTRKAQQVRSHHTNLTVLSTGSTLHYLMYVRNNLHTRNHPIGLGVPATFPGVTANVLLY